ncbi:molybdopterin-dependent oxidoreductase [Roseiconus nitratireducens]|uniref:Molybdopterin-dependent oxidoreductase n=1 Tax=Roseiconus nitratireducens TaxID=2605748 RepID=A0A5M6D5K5_9BACT|nr:molybdopterin-dependent oxidoreductase [Roseiconus nitratireducens]KAA5542771.1 molybdopterin-dependent oxidoreductase [Roseiconus nitratireducens]
MHHDQLPPNQQLVKGDRWPVVGERAPREDDAPWTVTLCGEVESCRTWTVEELRSLPQVHRQVDVHCVTRWSKLEMPFEGVRFAEIVHDQSGDPLWKKDATHVSFVARSDRGHSTSLPLDELLRLDPILAFSAQGQPLSQEHGGPVRMVVPGKYFYKSVKWLERIEFLRADRPGYWEGEAGYHNGADPWREQRYIAASVGKQEASRLIRQRDFSGRDLLSLQASGMNLEKLRATGALLRNADFRSANLRNADFRGANLSNAHLQSADLRDADFRDADLEGADLSDADLRGADLRGTSLFGATFCVVDQTGFTHSAATIDSSTRLDPTSLQGLTAEQRQFVESSHD